MKRKTKKQSQITPKSETDILFSEALIKAQKQRNKVIDSALDKAMKVINTALDDNSKDTGEKMFPAKLAIDTYMLKEKLLRDDAKNEIERAKLEIEKAKLSVPGGPLYVIQNIENQQNNSIQSQGAKEELRERKRLQAQLLEKVSGVPQLPPTFEDSENNN